MLTGLLPVAKRRHSRRAWTTLLEATESKAEPIRSLDDDQIRKAGLALQYRARSGEPLDHLLPETFALVREAGDRFLGMRHYDVQLLGGIAMHQGCIAEMQTGEGKTLTATLPITLAALRGQGAHMATANDYLAERDAELMKPIYQALGLSVGVVQSESTPQQRREAYACDITYGTAKEFGFDFLRDRLEKRHRQESGGATQRSVRSMAHRYFVLVDEADALLIDEARTPLIVSAAPDTLPPETEQAYRWAHLFVAGLLEYQDFEWTESHSAVHLTPAGRRRVRASHRQAGVASLPLLDLYSHVELALQVQRKYQRDRHYVVRDDEVVIVDEFTGRLSEGRRWRDGIHQALEAKEGLSISAETGQAARVTIQSFFLKYKRLCGMTGTAANATAELSSIYNVEVVDVPTHRPPQRIVLPDIVYGTEREKWLAIAEEVGEAHAAGRPVLVGTRSIDKSEHLSGLLHQMQVEHQVLNARHAAAEAEIVGQAGQRGRVTVATNMAGRGTDIRLGPGVDELGGLYVIGTELHESQRIDRQLIGRCGRQGDPGTFRQYLSLEDEILRKGLGDRVADRLSERGAESLGPLGGETASMFYRAQRRIERSHFKQRRRLMESERHKQLLHRQMGQDPYLDAPV